MYWKVTFLSNSVDFKGESQGCIYEKFTDAVFLFSLCDIMKCTFLGMFYI